MASDWEQVSWTPSRSTARACSPSVYLRSSLGEKLKATQVGAPRKNGHNHKCSPKQFIEDIATIDGKKQVTEQLSPLVKSQLICERPWGVGSVGCEVAKVMANQGIRRECVLWQECKGRPQSPPRLRVSVACCGRASSSSDKYAETLWAWCVVMDLMGTAEYRMACFLLGPHIA